MIDERQTGRVSSPPYEEAVDRPDGRHLLAVLWRWKVLIAAGTIFFLAAAFALLRLTPVNAATADRPSRNALRTLVLTALLGFAVMSGVAFLLEYAERP